MSHKWYGKTLIAFFAVAALLAVSAPGGRAQQDAQSAPPPVIRAETRLVLVDTVVTDKKSAYVTDLAQKDFKVWEDGKEVPVVSFSSESSSPTCACRRLIPTRRFRSHH